MPARARPDRVPAATAPVARVCVDVGLPHLDRPFEYLVPAAEDARAQPGVRVRVRFAGQLVDGYLLERAETPEHPGRLSYLERVVSPERVLTPEVAALARAVADRYAGTLADVLRLAVPPRHARAEQSSADLPAGAPGAPDAGGWAAYPAGSGFHAALGGGRFPRAVWTALPGEDWPARYAEAAATAVHAGMGAVLVVADARDLDRLDAALTTALGPGRHVALAAALGPAQRYQRFLTAARGAVPVVAGTRAAVFAPVDKLGLVAIWDDGDDLHAEPRAPYPHAREVLLTRAQLAGAAALIGGYARSVEAQSLVAAGWAKEIVAARDTIRHRAPAVLAASDDPREHAAARLPSVAWKAARDALAGGAPVLVQVPRRGYLPAVACADCHTPARCPHCQGPLALPAGSASTPACRWCGRTATGYACPECGSRRLRAAVVGARRTAEELGRAFPGVPVRTSGRDSVLASVPAEAAVVVCTPGAEPVAEPPGYGAVLLLDTWALLTRADLRAGEETLRRWLAAAALARPADAGGRVVVVADGALAPVQALRRFDPGWLADRELAGRRELGFPPTVRMASLTGTPDAIAELLQVAKLPDAVEQLGPVPLPDGQERLLLRTTRRGGAALAQALRAAAGVRSARKRPDPVRLQLDPAELL
jgi:primosomal protein N' (replication factor Y) (superfamily II helicase)